MRLQDHPTVRWYAQSSRSGGITKAPSKLEAAELRDLCLKAGADDAGFVEIDRPAIAPYRQELLDVLPGTMTLISLVFRLNKEVLRTVVHSAADLEFHLAREDANRTARSIVSTLQNKGIRALNPSVGFPYEADRWPGKIWLTPDKPIAEEAGLGRMGWNRLVLHPKFGDAVVLGTILVGAETASYDSPLDYNPCIECKLCVSVCPVGAIAADGQFSFVSCYTHSYRERLGGFSNWIEQIVASKTPSEYRKKVSDPETISMWQNLSIGAQTKCDRCMAVCPAGEEAIGEFLDDRKGYIEQVVKRLREKKETVYVAPGSDAEAHVKAHFPNKSPKQVSNGLRPNSVAGFLQGLPLLFQRGRSKGMDATFHFTFTGADDYTGTVVIREQRITVDEGHLGVPDLHVIADSRTWLGFLAREKSLLWALVSRKVRLKGSPKLMKAFAGCFPL